VVPSLRIEKHPSAMSLGDQTNQTRLVAADDEVAEAFDIPAGAPVFERARTRQGCRNSDTHPHQLTTARQTLRIRRSLTNARAGRPGGGFAVLTLQGLEPDTITESLQARMPTPTRYESYSCPLASRSWSCFAVPSPRADVLVEFARGVHAASRFSWTYTFKIPD
jgi:GntR family transcriptional regulator